MLNIDELRFDKDGLIPVVVQDLHSQAVLTVAYMNRESLAITLAEGRTCFWSRSRQELWRKGETSGNVQQVASVTADCDRDALLIQVEKAGPACHLGTDSCFNDRLYENAALTEKARGNFSLDGLFELLRQRDQERPQGSYTTYLFEKGLEKILKKVGEESTEVVIAAMKSSREEAVYEIADLTYHLLVLMVALGLSPDDIRRELAARHVIDHKVKQETMK